jgi:hypothetical protein
VTGTDLFQEAAAELYATDPDKFIERRGALVAQARAAGQAPAAKRIAGLRKPTRSAWVLNQLVRAVPEVPSELARLGQELRAAQRSLDGAAIRELSLRRRQLIETLTRQAFRVSGLPAPSAVLRDEGTATLGAALADPEVAESLGAGTLERAARSEGFGTGPPTLTLVTSSGRRPSRTAPARDAPRGPRALAVAGTAAPPRPAPRAAPPAETAGAERERRRQAALGAAEQAVADAAQAAEAATAAEQKLERTVQVMEEQLADARRSLSDTRAQARRARNRQRQARLALDRLQR